MLDNIADLVLTVGLLVTIYNFPVDFALSYMVPGTAIGVLLGDGLFTLQALRTARITGRNDITAMPLGLDTPSTFGMVFFVLGPAYDAALLGLDPAKEGATDPERLAAAMHAWHIGIWAILISGVFKFACAIGSGWIRRVVPRAGLLGSLTAVALVLISFLPLLEIIHLPVVGLVALAILLTSLVARMPLPGRIPGALGALIAGTVLYYAMQFGGLLGHSSVESAFDPNQALLPTGWFEVFTFGWVAAFEDSLKYMPIVIPFALGTVVGGIDCTESAAAAGDEFDTRQVIGIEALATFVAALCGGVIQTTPYIGHPAYKAMGGRAAYTLATALFIGGAGVFGYFAWIYNIVPQPAVLPILIFIGLEITAQSFHATPTKHYPAVAFACVPALAALVIIFVDRFFGDPAIFGAGITQQNLQPELAGELQTLRILSNGFIVTSLLWASWLAALIDRRLFLAAIYACILAVCALFGVIHSPFPGSPLAVPWNLPAELPSAAAGQSPVFYAVGYLAVAAVLSIWAVWRRATGAVVASLDADEESA